MKPLLVKKPAERRCGGDEQYEKGPRPTFLPVTRLHCRKAKALGEIFIDALHRRSVSRVVPDGIAVAKVDSLQDGAQVGAQRARRHAADDTDEQRMGTVHGPQCELAHIGRLQATRTIRRERLLDEILNRGKHRGDSVAVLDSRSLVMGMRDQQAVIATDQIGLLDPILQGPLNDILAKRYSRAPCFQAPFDTLGRYTLFDRIADLLGEGTQRIDDRLADGGAHDRVQRIRIFPGLLLEGLLDALPDRIAQGADEIGTLPVANAHRLGQDVGDVDHAGLRLLHTLRDGVERLLLGTEQQALELLQVVHRQSAPRSSISLWAA